MSEAVEWLLSGGAGVSHESQEQVKAALACRDAPYTGTCLCAHMHTFKQHTRRHAAVTPTVELVCPAVREHVCVPMCVCVCVSQRLCPS